MDTPPYPLPFAGTLTPVEQLLGPRLGEDCVKQGGPGESPEEQQMAPAAEVPAHQLEALLLRPPAGRPQLHALPHRRDERQSSASFSAHKLESCRSFGIPSEDSCQFDVMWRD
ncbi:hypothetical protein CDAR_94991 [Caerostris darwini]|uniref:Uncharacterized protein n=1 Tax=Caerostris darwini TaxID=1538125 RepID=A0AAV4PLI7_9ARAC|nr:hypothetical protein CDAR_94991 [Caerostris darwini]